MGFTCRKFKRSRLVCSFFGTIELTPLHSNTLGGACDGSYAEISASVSGAETPCLQTRPRPQVSSDQRRFTLPPPHPPCLFLRGYSEPALRRTPEPPLHRRSERRPSAAAAVPGQHLSFPSLRLHMDYLFGLPPGCVSPATFTLAMPTSGWRAQRPKIVCLTSDFGLR